jgi:hypothetical protein
VVHGTPPHKACRSVPHAVGSSAWPGRLPAAVASRILWVQKRTHIIHHFYLALAAILLLPLAPAFVIYEFLPDSDTEVAGPYKKLNLKLKGAFAGYSLPVLTGLGLPFVILYCYQSSTIACLQQRQPIKTATLSRPGGQ